VLKLKRTPVIAKPIRSLRRWAHSSVPKPIVVKDALLPARQLATSTK